VIARISNPSDTIVTIGPSSATANITDNPAVNINLGSLNGTTGFRLDGVTADDNSGFSVSDAGDVNGDGFDDVIIGARLADPNGGESGSSSCLSVNQFELKNSGSNCERSPRR
jgi:hypothetical protein